MHARGRRSWHAAWASFLANCRSLPAQFVDTNVCDQFYSKKCCGQTIHGKASRHALAN